jgi:alpha-N-arabinofuranosidase
MCYVDYTSTTYGYRWQRFHDALSSAYPNVSYIATGTIAGVDLPSIDLHDFSGPDFFYSIFDRSVHDSYFSQSHVSFLII